tara:strand:- start:89 stop:316 length:228 start_codon:yes stop_codon:yes gene_type:complete
MKYLIRLIKYILIVYFFSLTNAFAYLDPGTGSVILQAIIAAIAAASATVTFYWRKIKMKIKSLFTKKNKTNNSDQ